MTTRDPDDDDWLGDYDRAEEAEARRYCPECRMTGGHVYGCPNDDDDGEGYEPEDDEPADER